MRSTPLLLAAMPATVLATVFATSGLATPRLVEAQRPAAAAARQATALDSADRRVLAVARDVIRAARFAALITRDAAGGSSARTIDPAPPDSAMVVRFVTNPRSRKVRELARDARVTLYYFDATGLRYVTMQGVSREVRNVTKKGAYWYAEWTPFYPGKERAATMYEVRPTRLEVVSEADRVVGDSVTWAVPMVRLRAPGGARP
jgi:general stress protein 26